LGYESVVANWNAAEAIPWFLKDFDIVEYFTVVEGMDKIPDKLYTAFRREIQDPSCLRTDYFLQEIEKGPASLKLVFRNEALGEYATTFAKRVILAMPRHALEKIRLKGFSDAPEEFGLVQGDTIEDLDSVTSHPMAKLFLGYEDAWWSKSDIFGSTTGKLTTDSPLRQVYFIGPESHSADSEKVPSLLMASYSDSHYVDFWKPLYPRSIKWDPFYIGDPASMTIEHETILGAFGIGDNVINKAVRLTEKLYPGKQIPHPYMGLLVTWDGPPYYGGWHTWNVHQKPWVLREQLRRPFRSAELYVCGEAYSREQGWVEGALRSAESVLRELGVPEPNFVDTEQYQRQHYTGYQDYIA
jgi:monoamine oxidase